MQRATTSRMTRPRRSACRTHTFDHAVSAVLGQEFSAESRSQGRAQSSQSSRVTFMGIVAPPQCTGPGPLDVIRCVLNFPATSAADSLGCRFNSSANRRSASTFITFEGTPAT